MKMINLHQIHLSLMQNKYLSFIASLFSLAEVKSIMNAIIMPVLFTVLFKNIFMGLLWVFLVVIIYEKIQAHKIENKRAFYTTLKWFTTILFLITLTVLGTF